MYKKELRYGHSVVLRDGSSLQVDSYGGEGYVLSSRDVHYVLNDYKRNMCHKSNKSLDIVKVFYSNSPIWSADEVENEVIQECLSAMKGIDALRITLEANKQKLYMLDIRNTYKLVEGIADDSITTTRTTEMSATDFLKDIVSRGKEYVEKMVDFSSLVQRMNEGEPKNSKHLYLLSNNGKNILHIYNYKD